MDNELHQLIQYIQQSDNKDDIIRVVTSIYEVQQETIDFLRKELRRYGERV